MIDAAKFLRYCTNKHREQIRKYTMEPYIGHPIAVCGRVSLYAKYLTRLTPVEAQCIALGHDLFEDTDATEDEVLALTNANVVQGIWCLTDTETGNRKQRKQAQCVRIANSYPDIQLIKACDSMDNLVSTAVHDKNFARVFLREKADMLEIMTLPDEVLEDVVAIMTLSRQLIREQQ